MNKFNKTELKKIINDKIKSNKSFEIAIKDFVYLMELNQFEFPVENDSDLFEYFLRSEKIELGVNKLVYDKIEKDSVDEQIAFRIINIAYSKRYSTNEDEILEKPKTDNKINLGGYLKFNDTRVLLLSLSTNYDESIEVFDFFEPNKGTKWFHEIHDIPVSQIGSYTTLALHPFFNMNVQTNNFIDRIVLSIFSKILIRNSFITVDNILKNNKIKFIYFIAIPRIFSVLKECGIYSEKMHNLKLKNSEHVNTIVSNFKKYWNPENHQMKPCVFLRDFQNGPIDYHFRQFHIHIDDKIEYLTIKKYYK